VTQLRHSLAGVQLFRRLVKTVVVSLSDLTDCNRCALHADRETPSRAANANIVPNVELVEIARQAIKGPVGASQCGALHALVGDPALNADKIVGRLSTAGDLDGFAPSRRQT
jgi:hypothetical protein